MDHELSRAAADLNLGEDEPVEQSVSKDPFAKVIRSNHRARDVTEQMLNASKALRLGQLIKNDYFTLLESVQALEIMDPKMDSGYLAPGESLDDDFDVCKDLHPYEVVGIMDQMLQYEMAWHQGYPLSQTLLTSLHLDHLLNQKDRPPGTVPLFLPSTSEDRNSRPMLHLVLRAYCIGVIKSCDITIEMIASQLYFEEEDFCTQTYGRDLLTDVSDEDCLTLLDDATVYIGEQLSDDKDLAKALAARLSLKRDFIDAFMPAPNKPMPKLQFRSAKKYLEYITESHNRGRQVNDAFSSKIHRRLASNAPPRPPIELSFTETYAKLEHLYKDLLRVLDAVAYEGGLAGLRTFLWSFASRDPQPSTFARAYLQSMTVGEGQFASFPQVCGLVEEDLRMAIYLGQESLNPEYWQVEHPGDWRFQIARTVDHFWELAGPEYTKVFQCLCQNRCRIRRSLINTMENFDILLGNLKDSYDEEKQNPTVKDPKGMLLATKRSFMICIQTHLFQIMTWVIKLGFEQDIMQPHELGLNYWFLSRLLRDLCCCYGEPADSDDFQGPTWHLTHEDEAHMIRGSDAEEIVLANYSVALYTLCRILNLIPSPRTTPFADPALLWELRMRPFLTLRNVGSLEYFGTIPTFAESQTWAGYLATSAKLIESATKEFDSARETFGELRKEYTEDPLTFPRERGFWRSEKEWLLNLQNAEKTCVQAKLVLHMISGGIKKYGEQGLAEHATLTIPAAEKRYLATWIVPDVVVR